MTTAHSATPPNGRGGRPDGDVTGWAVLYLALPSMIFLLGWLQWWAAVIGGLALATALGPLLHGRAAASHWRLPLDARAAALLGIAIGWSALGGAGHVFYANSDWVVRDAVLRDLVIGQWPVGYLGASGQPIVLRSPIGYFLPAAIVGKMLGPGLADAALLAWTALGVWLLLCLVIDRDDPPAKGALTVLVIVLFSGMDAVGVGLAGGEITPTKHLEWWAGLFQFSSNTTQLFWAPGHALPGWLAAAILVRRLGDAALARILPVIVALVPLWSPLTALGVLPIALAAFAQRVRLHGFGGALAPAATAGALIVLVLEGLYLTAGSERIASGWIWSLEMKAQQAWTVYGVFVLLEVAIPLIVVMWMRPSLLVVVAALTLLALPVYRFGPGNDLVMRASIPALMVTAIVLAQALPAMLASARLRAGAAVAVLGLAVGAVTPLTEIVRALELGRWSPDPGRRVVDATPGAHYLAALHEGALSRMLRPVRFLGGQSDGLAQPDGEQRRRKP